MKSTAPYFGKIQSLTLAYALTTSLVMAAGGGIMPLMTQQVSAQPLGETSQAGQEQQQQFGSSNATTTPGTNATTTTGTNTTTTNTTIIIPQGAGNQSVPSGHYYQPINATIPAGTTVTWVNQDTAAHTSTSGNPQTGPSGEFDTGLFMAGQSASVPITSEPGTTIPYYCTVHPWMTGTITVVTNGTQATPMQQQQQQPMTVPDATNTANQTP